jgi:hypothetical protein
MEKIRDRIRTPPAPTEVRRSRDSASVIDASPAMAAQRCRLQALFGNAARLAPRPASAPMLSPLLLRSNTLQRLRYTYGVDFVTNHLRTTTGVTLGADSNTTTNTLVNRASFESGTRTAETPSDESYSFGLKVTPVEAYDAGARKNTVYVDGFESEQLKRGSTTQYEVVRKITHLDRSA